MDRYNYELTGSKSGDNVEVVIRDSSNKKIDVFKWNRADKKKEQKIISILYFKYDLFFKEIDNENKKDKDKFIDDTSWIG